MLHGTVKCTMSFAIMMKAMHSLIPQIYHEYLVGARHLTLY